MLQLDDVPDATNEIFHSTGPGSEGKPTNFIVWPARDAAKRRVNIRISTRELSDLAGVDFGINSGKIAAALRTNRAYIERRANEELSEGANEVVLDVGSLFPIR